MIGIDEGESARNVGELVTRFKIPFPVGIDSGSIQSRYTAFAFPTLVAIGLDKRVRYYHAGYIQDPGPALARAFPAGASAIHPALGKVGSRPPATDKNQR